MESDGDAVLTFLHQLTLVLTWNVACGLALALLKSYLCVLTSLSRPYSLMQKMIAEALFGQALCWLARYPLGVPREECLNIAAPAKGHVARTVIFATSGPSAFDLENTFHE